MGRNNGPFVQQPLQVPSTQYGTVPEKTKDKKLDTYNLCWKDFPSNLLTFFKELQEAGEFVDVTLACDGQQISAHKVVLSAASPFFRNLLKNNPCKHPIIILNDVRYGELLPLLQYMYNGDVQVEHHQITDFLRTAKLLQVRGLAGESDETPPPSEEQVSEPTPALRTPTPNLPEDDNPSTPPSAKRPKFSESPSSPPRPESRASSSPPPSLVPGGVGSTHPMTMSLPSSITTLPPVTSTVPTRRIHTPTSPLNQIPSVFPQMFQPPPYQPPQLALASSANEDTNDTCGSDKSEDKPSKGDGELLEEDQESSLDKMSGLANINALKGLAGFPGPSGLVGLASAALGSSPDGNSDFVGGRPRFDFYRVRATDPRPCHLCGKIYKNAHTLRTHMEDKHSNCNGFRCVLCGTVAKSRNSLHSHMSRQHRGISTKDLPLLPMPAPWNPEMAARYIQIVGGVGEVVRQNYRRADNTRDGTRENSKDPLSRSQASTPTSISQENGTLSPYLKQEYDLKDKRPYDAISRHLELAGYVTKPPAASLLDTYLQMMRASGVDLHHPPSELPWEDPRNPPSFIGRPGVLDLTCAPPEDDDGRASDNYSDEERNGDVRSVGRGRGPVVTVTPRSPEPSDNEDDGKWAVQ